MGRMKSDVHLGRNHLKGKLDGKLNALLCTMGHHFQLLLHFEEKAVVCLFIWKKIYLAIIIWQ